MTINIEIMNVTEIQIVDTGYLTTEINIVMIGKDIIVRETVMIIQKYRGQKEMTGAITKMIKVLTVAQGKEVGGQMSLKEEQRNIIIALMELPLDTILVFCTNLP